LALRYEILAYDAPGHLTERLDRDRRTAEHDYDGLHRIGDDPINGTDPTGDKKIVVLFEGLLVNVLGLGSTAWVQHYWANALSTIKGIYWQYDHRTDEKQALNFIKKTLGVSSSNYKDTIIIAGFSFGGDAAITLANDLGAIPVYAGLTVDPRWQNDSLGGSKGDKGLRPFDKPKNAQLWENFYQHSANFPGNSVNGADQDTLLPKDFYAPYVKPSTLVKNPSNTLDAAYNNSHVNGYTVQAETQRLVDLIKNAPDSWK
jgi:YD repeat-containing protein